MKFDKWTPSMKEAYQQDLNEIKRLYSPQIAMDLNEAEERGELRKAREMAFGLLQAGVGTDIIAKTSGLSVEEITLLKNKQ
jgi:hypothetical protein